MWRLQAPGAQLGKIKTKVWKIILILNKHTFVDKPGHPCHGPDVGDSHASSHHPGGHWRPKHENICLPCSPPHWFRANINPFKVFTVFKVYILWYQIGQQLCTFYFKNV